MLGLTRYRINKVLVHESVITYKPLCCVRMDSFVISSRVGILYHLGIFYTDSLKLKFDFAYFCMFCDLFIFYFSAIFYTL